MSARPAPDRRPLSETRVRRLMLWVGLWLARLAADSGLDGVVCSAEEAAQLRRAIGADFVTVTPGIRLPGDAKGDQAADRPLDRRLEVLQRVV